MSYLIAFKPLHPVKFLPNEIHLILHRAFGENEHKEFNWGAVSFFRTQIFTDYHRSFYLKYKLYYLCPYLKLFQLYSLPASEL
jgi:hypothetical protein